MGEYRWHGLRLARWIEHPFEWERPHRFRVVRDYTAGPIRRFEGGTELLPAASGTTLRIFVEFVPKNWLAGIFIRRFLVPTSLERTRKQYQLVSDFLGKRSAHPFPQLIQQRTPADGARLQTGLQRLSSMGLAADGLNLLRDLIAEAPDEEVAGMRPLQLAADRGFDPDRTLEVFLHATVGGLLEMRWEMLCPGCRGVKADAGHLSELQATAHCDACNLDFEPDTDELIEARFYPAPSIRSVEVGTYCVSGPGKTPHRVLQTSLEPGQARDYEVSLDEGSYVIHSPQTQGFAHFTAVAGSAAAQLEVSAQETALVSSSAEVQAGERTLKLANSTSRELTLTIDRAHATTAAATPGRLMTFPAFRSLFSAEALAPGIQLEVSRVGLLFTDLAGSTALYDRVGDARAFRLVSEHFGLLQRAIEDAGGAIVKTIGDAVMAAFPDGRSAVDAGLRIQRCILELNTRGLVNTNELVKVGINTGACFAVTQNERLDYFGTVVNVAARAEHEAHGGEIVMTQPAYEEASDLLGTDFTTEPFTVQLKGISVPTPLVRISGITN